MGYSSKLLSVLGLQAICCLSLRAQPTIPAGQAFTVTQGDPDNKVVGVVEVSDSDPAVILHGWHIAGGSGQAIFSIDASSGQLTLLNHFLLSPPPTSYDLSLQVSDAVGTSESQVVNVIVAAPPVSITLSGFALNRRTNRIVQQATLSNTSQSAVTGPIRLVLDHLSSNTSLLNGSGFLANIDGTSSPYVEVSPNDLSPSASLTAVLEFAVPASGGVQYSARTVNGGLGDADGDGIPDWRDLYPSDYYNAIAPLVSIVGGNNQSTPTNTLNPSPFDVAVWNHAGTAPLVNAPVTFQVLSGGGGLALTPSSATGSAMMLRTDVDGTARVYYKQPAAAGVTSTINAAASVSSVLFQSFSVGGSNNDVDGNGLPDAWELRYFGHIGIQPDADADGDGMTNLQEYVAGSDPTVASVYVYDFANGGLPDPANRVLVYVRLASGAPASNTLVRFKVTDGSATISSEKDGPFLPELLVRTDDDGRAYCFYRE